MSTYSSPKLRGDSLSRSATQILDAAFFETSAVDVPMCACACGETGCMGGGTATDAGSV